MRTQSVENKLSIKLGQKVSYKDIWGNDLTAYVMSKKITYLGGAPTDDDNYEITLSAEEINETSTEYSYSASIENRVLTVERTTDKQNGVIKDLVTSTEIIQKEIIPTSTVSGQSIHLEDSSDNKLINLEIEGKSKRATRSGKNLFDASKITNESIVVSDNGKTITMPIVTSGNGHTQTGSTLSKLCPNLQVGDEVYLYFNRNLGLKYNNMIYLSEANIFWYQETKKTITQTMLDSKLGLYSNRYINGETEQCILTDFRIVRNANDEWEQYGVSPSLDYPSETESIGYENLFDLENKIINQYNTNDVLQTEQKYLKNGNVTSCSYSNNLYGRYFFDKTSFFPMCVS